MAPEDQKGCSSHEGSLSNRNAQQEAIVNYNSCTVVPALKIGRNVMLHTVLVGQVIRGDDLAPAESCGAATPKVSVQIGATQMYSHGWQCRQQQHL